MHTRSLLVLAISSALLAAAAVAQVERQHAPHVHGVATGNLSMDDGKLRLELEIPGVNLVGFEHAPRNDDQQAALDGALAFLRTADDWLHTDPRGGCEVASINAHTHGFKDDHDHSRDHDHTHDHEHNHGHDHSHDHDHGHDHSDGRYHDHDHSEFHVVIGLECQNPDRLGWVDLRLFEDFPGNERMDIDVLTETLATQARLSPGAERITLR